MKFIFGLTKNDISDDIFVVSLYIHNRRPIHSTTGIPELLFTRNRHLYI